ncbi:hypothetical protein NLU13_6359 [Sarocladium strictum]|uniref:Uncharacterized protein n=1 Tax=Sarocladium strictum TaxID=5046 RepID=A0AA39L7B4_SARSR|nr:hypothetical protein NLU13_6359 [Sarocladium strictum]
MSELAESINSMFRWYNIAAVCIAFLGDFDASGGDWKLLDQARWFTRGWTLQELVAPQEVFFYDKDWTLFGTRSSLVAQLSSITAISGSVLSPPEGSLIRDLLDEIPVDRRMSWASNRQTTKKEDTAYCLLGIFGVNMPMLYGEGSQAFVRLQEEIIEDNNDLTIFAWLTEDGQPYRGIFATSPAEFVNTGTLEPINDSKFNPDFAPSNKGLRIQTLLYPTTNGEVIMPLFCRPAGTNADQVGLVLKHQGASVYTRTNARILGRIQENAPASSNSSIFLTKRLKSTIAKTIDSSHRQAFRFNFKFKEPGTVRLVQAGPEVLWDAANQVFLTSGLTEFAAFLRFQVQGKNSGEFVVACGSSRSGGPWVCCGDMAGQLFQVAVGGDYRTLAEMGKSRCLKRDKETSHDLMVRMEINRSHALRFGVAKLKWSVEQVNGEVGVVIDLSVGKNNALMPHRLGSSWE